VIFTKFGSGRGVPGPLVPNFIVVALKYGLAAPKIGKNGGWYKFVPKENWGPQKS